MERIPAEKENYRKKKKEKRNLQYIRRTSFTPIQNVKYKLECLQTLYPLPRNII